MSWKNLPKWIRWGIYSFLLSLISVLTLATLNYVFLFPFGIFYLASVEAIFSIFKFIGLGVGTPDYLYETLTGLLGVAMNALFYFILGSFIGKITDKPSVEDQTKISNNLKTPPNSFVIILFKIFLILSIIILAIVIIFSSLINANINNKLSEEHSIIRLKIGDIKNKVKSSSSLNELIIYCDSVTETYEIYSRIGNYKDFCLSEAVFHNRIDISFEDKETLCLKIIEKNKMDYCLKIINKEWSE